MPRPTIGVAMPLPSRKRVLLPAAILFAVAFVAGFAAHPYLRQSVKYRTVIEAFASLQHNVILPRIREPHEVEHYYYRTADTRAGVLAHDPDKAYAGATLFSASHEPAAYLIAMDGALLHEWRLPFSQAWESAPHLELPVPDAFVHFRKTYLFANGDLLAIYEAPGHWPYAYGLVKLDRHSKVLWKYADLVNHDLDVDADGRIHTLVHHVRDKAAGVPHPKQRSAIDDILVVLSKDGVELARVSLLDAFTASKYVPLLTDDIMRDVLHTNSVSVVTPEVAARLPFLEVGQVLLSHRKKSAISVLDIPSKSIVWARRGAWRMQHSARFLEDGTIGIFDNSGNIAVGGRSRVVAIDPLTGAETWAYAGSDSAPFYSESRGELQRLPNGNTLITESNAGRILEVTPARELVWEYRVGHAIDGKTPAVFWATRHAPGTLTFLGDTP
jgi:outer membrane protein assembly factor BamB